MKSIGMAITLAVLLLVSAFAAAEVPHLINYQGRLTDSIGQPVADATYSVQFSIHADSTGTFSPPLWTETQDVTTAEGLFDVLLGSVEPISPTLFDGSVRYLGITIASNPEGLPRLPIVSVPYALTAGSVVDAGSADCHSCDSVFINAVGPDQLTASADTALKVTNTGSASEIGFQSRLETGSTNPVSAIRGITSATSSIFTCAGTFEATATGPGAVYGLYTRTENSAGQTSTGTYSVGKNTGIGEALGGYFEAAVDGTGEHIGVKGQAFSYSNADCYGIQGESNHIGAGDSYGGYFTASGGGGARTGIYSTATGATEQTIYGSYTTAANSGNGKTYGGWFQANISPTSDLVGVTGKATAGDTWSKGVEGFAENNSLLKWAIGCQGGATNTGQGLAYGGYFTAVTHGGSGMGVYAANLGDGNSQSESYGVYGISSVSATVTSASYGGHFSNSTKGGTQYGVYARANYVTDETQYATYSLAEDATGSLSAFGVYGRCEHDGSGNSYGGYFVSDSTGTGTSYGVRPIGLSRGAAAAYGIQSFAANRHTGTVYGGMFEVLNAGTGTKYAVYGKSPSTGYAGYFEGSVRITNALTVVGTKSAAVKTADDEYRLVYCQESPENWFEDFGEGQLQNGTAHIDLDPVFLQTVTISAADPMKVFIQLNDPDCNGTAVIRGATGFDVVELQNGKGSASFSYRVVAKRRGYEDLRLERMTGLTPEQVSAETERDAARLRADEERQAKDRDAQKLSQERLERELEQQKANKR